MLGCAQTGTGKTAAFAIHILQRLHRPRRDDSQKRRLQALILTPARELALQISESFKAYGRFTGLCTTVIFGGVGQAPQVAALRKGVDILVATLGRLNDLIGQKLCDLSDVNMFVLDEADRMLDMGFIHDVKKVIARLPINRKTLLFSATMPDEIASLASSILCDPVTVKITPVSSTVDVIEQSVYFVDKANKGRLLVDLLNNKDIISALVFSRTKHGANRISRLLNTAGIAASAIHGNKSQNARQAALGNFKDDKIRALVVTDIAARGIDIDKLSHVINYDLLEVPETYVHRIGRTGRAGLSGVAISFCNFDEKAYLKEVQKLIKIEVPVVDNHAYPMQIFEAAPPKSPRPPKITRSEKESKGNNKAQKNKPVRKHASARKTGIEYRQTTYKVR